MTDTAIILLSTVAATAFVISLINYIEARSQHTHIITLYRYVQDLDHDKQDVEGDDIPLDPDVWETK